MPVTEHQRKVKKPKTKSASKSVKGSFLDQSVSRLMMDMPSARRQGFLDCIITQRHEHESYSGPRSDHAVAQETICTSHASGELSCCFLRLSDALDVIASRHRLICWMFRKSYWNIMSQRPFVCNVCKASMWACFIHHLCKASVVNHPWISEGDIQYVILEFSLYTICALSKFLYLYLQVLRAPRKQTWWCFWNSLHIIFIWLISRFKL